MKIRTRIASVVALSLIVAGSLTLLVNAFAFRDAAYDTWGSYSNDVFHEYGIDANVVLRYLEAHPEQALSSRNTQIRGPNGLSFDQAAQAVQRRNIERSVDRARRWTLAALGAVILGALLASWLLAGRILKPVRLMTERARAASELDLEARVSLEGPNDEMKEMADTFDVMLDRLAVSFDAQRRFSAQVAHELRTPLAVTQAEIEMLLDEVGDERLRGRLEAVHDASRRAERLVSELLVLSRTQTGDMSSESFALDDLVGNVVGRAVEGAAFRLLRVDLELEPTPVFGDRTLLECLVRNLVDNAGQHNRPNGWTSINVAPSPDRTKAVLEVSNSTSPPGDGSSAESVPGVAGIGLSLVSAVLDAHKGTVAWRSSADVVSVRVELDASTRPASRPLVDSTRP